MDTAVMGKIALMTERGQTKIACKAAEEDRLRLEQIEKFRMEWNALQAAMRDAFPEEIQPYIFVRYSDDEPDSAPPRIRGTGHALVKIPEYAPIQVAAIFDTGSGTWRQARCERDGNPIAKYSTPTPLDDYDNGIIWNWRYGTRFTDDLEEALALAKQASVDYDQMVSARIERYKRDHAPQEPVYESVDDEAGLVGELTAFIRGIVDEQLEQRNAA